MRSYRPSEVMWRVPFPNPQKKKKLNYIKAQKTQVTKIKLIMLKIL